MKENPFLIRLLSKRTKVYIELSEKSFNMVIKDWPKDERPREKLLKYGEHSLSNTELLAIILGSGIKGRSAISLAREILAEFGTLGNLSHSDLTRWRELKGIGVAKISQIKAAIEIGRRLAEEKVRENKPIIRSSKDTARLLALRMRDLKKEVFKIILLDTKNRLIDCREIAEGTINQVSPMIRDIFQKSLQYFAASIICVHNHPSGDPFPSKEDRDFTLEVCRAGKALRVFVLDHIIIGGNRYYSFADEGILPEGL